MSSTERNRLIDIVYSKSKHYDSTNQSGKTLRPLCYGIVYGVIELNIKSFLQAHVLCENTICMQYI